MKKIIILLSALFIVSCATSPITSPTTQAPQKVIIEVSSVTDSSVKIKESDSINKSMEVSNPDGKLSQLSFIANGKAFVKIFSGLSVADVTRLWNDIVFLEETTNVREVHIFINSPGGGAFDGLALADEIQRAQKHGFKMIAHASGIVASAAVPVLAVCRPRYAARGTIFMVHEAALWKWPGRETASDIKSQNELMDMLRSRYIKKMVDNSKLSKEEWEAMEKCTTWFSTEKAMEFGIVDDYE